MKAIVGAVMGVVVLVGSSGEVRSENDHVQIGEYVVPRISIVVGVRLIRERTVFKIDIPGQTWFLNCPGASDWPKRDGALKLVQASLNSGVSHFDLEPIVVEAGYRDCSWGEMRSSCWPSI